MKNLHLIATDKPSVLILRQDRKLFFTGYGGQLGKIHGLRKDVPQNIYITSDEYIGLSYYLDGNLVRKGVVDDKDYWEVRKDYKKIILTTDQDLIKDGVQAIDDEFLEWFVKNPSCEMVEVFKERHHGVEFIDDYPKGFFDYKIIIPQEEPKQETLEEADERILANNIDGLRDALQDDDLFFFYKGVIQCYGEAMAKWQQERMYSEEEVFSIIDKAFHMYASSHRYDAKEWFEQFKKK